MHIDAPPQQSDSSVFYFTCIFNNQPTIEYILQRLRTKMVLLNHEKIWLPLCLILSTFWCSYNGHNGRLHRNKEVEKQYIQPKHFLVRFSRYLYIFINFLLMYIWCETDGKTFFLNITYAILKIFYMCSVRCFL